jgi:hypothetical protein
MNNDLYFNLDDIIEAELSNWCRSDTEDDNSFSIPDDEE